MDNVGFKRFFSDNAEVLFFIILLLLLFYDNRRYDY